MSSQYNDCFVSYPLNAIARYYAKVEKVYPPKYVNDPDARDAHKDLPFDDSPNGKDCPHVIGANLKIAVKDAVAQDDPNLYFYWVHVTELERDKSRESKAMAAKAEKDLQMVGSLMEVQCGMLKSVLHQAPSNHSAHRIISPAETVSRSPSRYYAVSSVIVSIAPLQRMRLGS